MNINCCSNWKSWFCSKTNDVNEQTGDGAVETYTIIYQPTSTVSPFDQLPSTTNSNRNEIESQHRTIVVNEMNINLRRGGLRSPRRRSNPTNHHQ